MIRASSSSKNVVKDTSLIKTEIEIGALFQEVSLLDDIDLFQNKNKFKSKFDSSMLKSA